MHTSSIPWKALSSRIAAGVLTPGWPLGDPAPKTSGARSFSVEVMFDSPFTSPPVVHLGLTGFDLDQRDSSRLTVKAENITANGFQAVITTWASSRVFSVEFDWLAIGP
ncbi:MAG: H-type lectin domain-containing protein [Prosthecobacter sp.]